MRNMAFRCFHTGEVGGRTDFRCLKEIYAADGWEHYAFQLRCPPHHFSVRGAFTPGRGPVHGVTRGGACR